MARHRRSAGLRLCGVIEVVYKFRNCKITYMNNFDPTALCDRCGKTCRRKLSLRKSGQLWCVVCCMVRAAYKRRKKRHAKMLETGLKKCIRCDETKPLDQYPKARQKRNGEP